MIGKIKKFFAEVIVELKKVSWSTKQELKNAAWLIFVSTAFLIVFIATTDFMLSKIVGVLIN
ncbi:MAG: preprotein translocase subunit SecE [Candidatus Omnitrophica bacterium]|nr:preprotein translocase subunit SecE [Candidatus Omnitrophota bacterium]